MSTPVQARGPHSQPLPGVALSPLVSARARVLALWVDEVTVDAGRGAFDELVARAERWREACADRTIGAVPGVGEARRLYQSFGVDPTRTRPSSEALLRRALKGLELYHVDNLVDVGNLASLDTLLPLGLYDRDVLSGAQVLVRIGAPGEAYEGIRKGEVHLAGRLTVADELGPFGSPTSDSFRARVRGSTRRLLAIVFAPADGDPARLTRAADLLSAGFARYAGGVEWARALL